MSAKNALGRALESVPPWVSAACFGAAALILVDMLVGFFSRSLHPLPDDPAWRRAFWSGLVGLLSAFVAVGLLALVGSAAAPSGLARRRAFGLVAIVFALGFLAGGAGVVIDGTRVIGTAPANRAALLWTSVTIDALRGLLGCLFAAVVARSLLLASGPPETAQA